MANKWLTAVLVLLAGCAGPTTLVVGENVREVEPAPPSLQVVVSASDDLMPLGGAQVSFGGRVASTTSDGVAHGEWAGDPVSVEVNSPGFVPSRIDVVTLPDRPVEVTLVPVSLRGVVKAADGRPLPAVTVRMNGSETVTDESGGFTVSRAVPGPVTAERPAWHSAEATWDGSASGVELVMEPVTVRGLRVGGEAVADPAHWQEVLRLARTTSVNALVLDTKDEVGTVWWDTDVALADELGVETPAGYDLDKALADMDAEGLYKITRVVTFQDTPLGSAKPELAAKDAETNEPWSTYNGQVWLDPTDREAWEYALALAVAACEKGFDEIQFDYVRFPTDGPVGRLVFDDPERVQESRVGVIADFLSEARRRLHPLGCAVSADIFAIVVSVGDDQGIGQRPEELSQAVDVISPMIYPSHYGPNWLGLENPNDYPAEVVGQALEAGLPRLEGGAVMRPWLQTWPYGRTEIEIELNEAEERGLGWMLWSANTQFSESWLPPETGR